MKKGFKFIEIFIILLIVVVIGFIAGFIVNSVIKNMELDTDKLLIDNYANEVLYARELYMKNNENNVPKYCSINNNIIYYDENYNNQYDSNELLCNKECNNDNCIKYFITYKDIENKDIKCNKIIIEENNIELSNCYIKSKKINYQYKLDQKE